MLRRTGKGQLAQELRDLVEGIKQKQQSGRIDGSVPIARPKGELASLLAVTYPKTRLSEMVLGASAANALARATVQQWTTFENLFDILAELRLAKTLAGEYMGLGPSDQGEFVQEARQRIKAPLADAPSVCHLDTGVNRGHPLLELALAENHLLTVVPEWSPTDQDGDGTEMAGLALHGGLKLLLESNGPVNLQHCLESVKLYRADQPHDPELYGEITAQAASRIEIAAPERSQRAFCLTITADDRDEGYPSSWSARVNAICAGLEDNERTAPMRLLFAAAGNVPWGGRHNYPDFNHVQGMQDPAQSWNAISVGAYTEHAVIRSEGYDGWEPIAEPGRLSPASATSLIWANKSWPLKPDFVMGGATTRSIRQQAEPITSMT
jgi:hypothetical protein